MHGLFVIENGIIAKELADMVCLLFNTVNDIIHSLFAEETAKWQNILNGKKSLMK